MTSHSRHSVTGVTLPHLFEPSEVAAAIGCSEWWVKEQARRRRIPFTRLGGAYRFTAEHFNDIVRAFEEPPVRGREPEPERVPGPQPVSPRRPGQTPVTRLRAKRPRRASRPSESSHKVA